MLNKGNNATDLIESGRARICVFMCVRFFWFFEVGRRPCEEMCSRPPTVTNRELPEFHQLSHNSDIEHVYSGFRMLDELLSIAICSKTL